MNSINTNSYQGENNISISPTADTILQNFQQILPPEINTSIQNNFYIYSRDEKETDQHLTNTVLVPVINDIIDYIMQGSFKDIAAKRQYRKEQIGKMDEEKYRIIEKNLDANVGNLKNLVHEICDILHNKDALGYIPLSQFFGIPVIDEKDYTPSDAYYYKGISLNILLTRQIVCEGYKYYDEYLDYITPEYNVALDGYAHGSRRYYKPFQDGYILCINKEKLHQHLESLKNDYKKNNEEYYQINIDHKNELYLYHSIVPISCVDSIIKIPKKAKE